MELILLTTMISVTVMPITQEQQRQFGHGKTSLTQRSTGRINADEDLGYSLHIQVLSQINQSLFRTSLSSRAAMSAVTLCWLSIRMRLPADGVPSLSFTVGLHQAMR